VLVEVAYSIWCYSDEHGMGTSVDQNLSLAHKQCKKEHKSGFLPGLYVKPSDSDEDNQLPF